MNMKPVHIALIIIGTAVGTLIIAWSMIQTKKATDEVTQGHNVLEEVKKTVPIEPKMDWVCICLMDNGGLTFHFTDTAQNKSLFTTAPTMTPTVGLPRCPLYRCFKDAQRLKQAVGLET